MTRQRLTARDYKGARRDGPDWRRWREFAWGLGAGLLVALIVFVGDRRREAAAERDPSAQHDAADTKPGARTRTGAGAASGANAASDPVADAAATGAGDYQFYNRLPKYEVVVPEKEHGARVDAMARVDRPGTYFLQAGSYRSQPDAERIRAQLVRQDIPATVQRVALDTDVWYRIRVGPIKDLAQLDRMRRQLRAADIESLVIRVED